MAVDTDLEQPGGPQTRPNKPAEGAPGGYPGQVPSGPPVAPTLPEPVASDTGLPPGVHPLDQSSPEQFEPGREEPSSPTPTGKRPFSVPNGEAFAVNQRASERWRASVVVVSTNQGGTSQVVGRLKGRRSLTLWVPTQLVVGGALVVPANGIMFASTEGEIQNGAGAFLAVGDSVTIESEGAVAVGVPPGATSAFAQWLDLFDAPGITGID